MRKPFLKLSVFFGFFLFVLKAECQTNYYDSAQLYPVAELKSDFRFLRRKLEELHPNLYLYTPKNTFDLFFDSLDNTIVQPLNGRAFYNRVTLFHSKIKDGHTMLLPPAEAMDYFNENAFFFPFDMITRNGRLFVNMNCTADGLIKEGAEIKSINGMAAADLLQDLLVRQIRDGDNQTYPEWILSNYFAAYYSFLFGHPASFMLGYKNKDGEERTTTINALQKDSMKFYRQAKYADRVTGSKENNGIVLETIQPGVAMLTIKSFDTDILKSVYKQEFEPALAKIFGQIQRDHIHQLILDIRNNQGGDFKPGRILLGYLLQQPINFLPGSRENAIIQPDRNNYTGKLYILINGGSFSITAIVGAYLEKTKRGIFIGEESAGNKNIIGGDAINFILPHTKISVDISTKKYVIGKNSYNDGHGIIPAYSVTSTIDEIIQNRDTAREFALALILKNK